MREDRDMMDWVANWVARCLYEKLEDDAQFLLNQIGINKKIKKINSPLFRVRGENVKAGQDFSFKFNFNDIEFYEGEIVLQNREKLKIIFVVHPSFSLASPLHDQFNAFITEITLNNGKTIKRDIKAEIEKWAHNTNTEMEEMFQEKIRSFHERFEKSKKMIEKMKEYFLEKAQERTEKKSQTPDSESKSTSQTKLKSTSEEKPPEYSDLVYPSEKDVTIEKLFERYMINHIRYACPFVDEKEEGVAFHLHPGLPETSFCTEAFDIDSIKELKQKTHLMIEDLNKMENLAKSQFAIPTGPQKKERFDLKLKFSKDWKDTREWKFVLRNKTLEITIGKPHEMYSPEIRSLALLSKTVNDTEQARSLFLKIINDTKNLYKNLIKKCDERMEFLKQPVTSFEELTKSPDSSVDQSDKKEKGIARYQMYAKWLEEFKKALKQSFVNVEGTKVFGGRLTIRPTIQDVSRKLKGIEKLKKLTSIFPDLNNFTASIDIGDSFFCDLKINSGIIELPSVYSIKQGRKTLEKRMIPQGKKHMLFSEWLNRCESFLKRELKTINRAESLKKELENYKSNLKSKTELPKTQSQAKKKTTNAKNRPKIK